MYTRFFGLNEKPFAITPDPRYLYLSERHGEALAHLIYGVTESGGFIQLTGEVGTGKTTLVRSLLLQLPDMADVAVVLNPQLSRAEFLATICEELGIALPAERTSIKALTDALNSFLLANHSRGRRTILIVDEAQNLRLEVLEQVRLLTNLETASQKLLQIILIGQPELRVLLARNDMRQLAQRITGRYHLEPLTREETLAYIDHRLKVAGGVGQIFTPAARRELHRITGGIPRMINVIADRALLGGYTREEHQITPALVRNAAAEVFAGNQRDWSGMRWQQGVVLAGLAIVLLAGFGWIGAWWSGSSAERAPAVSASPVELVEPVIIEAAEPAALTETAVPTALAAGRALPAVLAATADQTGTDSAFATLFDLWGIPFDPAAERACEQAEEHELYCLYQRGSLSQLRSLDKPAILTLRDNGAEPHQVVLSGLSEELATLSIGDRQYRVSTAELDDYWYGEYLLLWRPPLSEIKAIGPGDRDPDVLWLRESLSAIEGRPAEPMGSELFDAELADRVRAYQRARRLTVDGLVGQQTQIAIDADLGTGDRPRLTRAN